MLVLLFDLSLIFLSACVLVWALVGRSRLRYWVRAPHLRTLTFMEWEAYDDEYSTLKRNHRFDQHHAARQRGVQRARTDFSRYQKAKQTLEGGAHASHDPPSPSQEDSP